MVLSLLVDNNAKKEKLGSIQIFDSERSVKKKVSINFENCNKLKKKWAGAKKGQPVSAALWTYYYSINISPP
jgi:hypothetical protein